MLKQWLRELLPVTLQVPAKYVINAWRGQLEPELKLLRLLVKPGDHAIDVGGNRGVYAYALSRLGAKVEVFEPNPVCAKVVEPWASDKKTVVLHKVALSDTEGVAELHIPIDDAGIEHDASASLEHADFTSVRNESVALRTLDSFAFEQVGFVKIDVEGHEFNVLRGGENLLRNQRPSVLVEIEQRHSQRPINEIFGLLMGWGFQGFFLDAGRLTPLASFDLARDQRMEDFAGRSGRYINNFLFLHEGRLAQGNYTSLFQEWGGV